MKLFEITENCALGQRYLRENRTITTFKRNIRLPGTVSRSVSNFKHTYMKKHRNKYFSMYKFKSWLGSYFARPSKGKRDKKEVYSTGQTFLETEFSLN